MVPITGENLSRWAEEMSLIASKVAQNFEATFGYPPGTNVVARADTDSGSRAVALLSDHGINGDLLDLYSKIEKVSLPDVDRGFFIHSAEEVSDGIRDGQPTKLTGAVDEDIVVFGSDGGGALFALSPANKVYRLDGGAMVGSVYDAGDGDVSIIAWDLWGFLEFLKGEVMRWVPPGWGESTPGSHTSTN
jgi:hypothetical protein